ncbi:hypothetical protein PSTT_07995 [Puccinia striiformis]|uniref:HAT C-terminal dimerisation domain-containing protein n=1 Tax=Puccinia striiformis TaxID=27350 RepID=A0A2S4VE86_9BASI|nr:hypothetical protein PSTT_07995 [Puccinia striiformis]
MASAPIPPSLHQTPSRPPSRQSTRIITPVRTDPNFVRPNADLRKTITQRETPTTKQQGQKKRKTRARKDSEFGLDNIELYFHQPVFSNGATTFTLEPDAEGQSQSGKIVELEPLYYKCRWCGVTYKKGEGTRGNLVKHRDGTANRAPCTHRANAIRAIAKLPLTAKEVAAAKEMVADKSGAFNFDPRILNQIIVIRPGLKLNSRVWAASEAHKLYCNLQEKVISTLNNLPSKITLIHDVWTTKGNRQAFMGILAAYVSENWEFKPRQRTLAQIMEPWLEEGTVPLLDGSESDSEASDDEAGTTPGDRIAAVLKKVDAVVLKITGSAAKRSEYEFWAPKVEEVAPPTLIAGYGIRWNIKFQSRDRAYQGRNVIHKLIEIERALVKRLNDVLKEFYFITKKMEGDISSAGMMLAEYRWIKTFLNQQLVSPNNTKFRPMFHKMITKTRQYAKSLIEAQFESKRIDLEAHAPTTRHPPTSEEPQEIRRKDHDVVNFFPNMVIPTIDNELSVYQSGKYNWPMNKADQPLLWWKEHSGEFPILSLLAKDYLACCATSASVERCFSAAADTCGRDRGSLASRTIERCVSSHQWLLQGFQPNGHFEAVQQILTQAATDLQQDRTIHVPIASSSTSL